MRGQLSSRSLFALGFALIVAANTVVLTGLAFNRSGEPEAEIILTERELRLPYRAEKENSGVTLQLSWRALSAEKGVSSSTWSSPAWLDGEKLRTLGFRTDAWQNAGGDEERYRKPLARKAFIVLEQDGAPYQEALRRAEADYEREKGLLGLSPQDGKLQEKTKEAKERLEREKNGASRLFAIDAGLDPRALREKYGDRTRYIIVKGSVQPGYGWGNNKKESFGTLSELASGISVPLEHRRLFDTLLVDNKKKAVFDMDPPRFAVKLAFGSRYEPWVVSVTPMGEK